MEGVTRLHGVARGSSAGAADSAAFRADRHPSAAFSRPLRSRTAARQAMKVETERTQWTERTQRTQRVHQEQQMRYDKVKLARHTLLTPALLLSSPCPADLTLLTSTTCLGT